MVLFMYLFSFTGSSQEVNRFISGEKNLITICNKLWKLKDDSSRIQTNRVLVDSLELLLHAEGSYDYSFDSLNGISRLFSDDRLFRIITWNIPLNNNHFKYFGFIQMKNGRIYRLEEKEELNNNWQNGCLGPDVWYGAIYYALITERYKRKSYYTLIGWDGYNASSNLKVIDILSFGEDGSPVFGGPVFKTPEGLKNRVIIEYAESGNATVRYDYQALLLKKGKRNKEIWDHMIVMDHLIPTDPAMEGERHTYVPSGDQYDGFIFQEGFWKFVENISVRNASSQNQNRAKSHIISK